MSTPVLMPQMGESIAEGTIVRWMKKVGDAVDRDEPLFEISTDKVDAEIPSPAAGVLAEITVKEGETVAVNSVVATIGAEGEAIAAHSGAAAAEPAAPQPQADGSPSPKSAPAQTEAPAHSSLAGNAPVAAPAPGMEGPVDGQSVPSKDEQRRAKSSPLVRKIAKEHDIDIRALQGSGIGGRVTKHDILGFIEQGAAGPDQQSGPSAQARASGGHAPVFRPGESVEVVPLSVMRRKIAEHMIVSRRTSAHVHSVF